MPPSSPYYVFFLAATSNELNLFSHRCVPGDLCLESTDHLDCPILCMSMKWKAYYIGISYQSEKRNCSPKSSHRIVTQKLMRFHPFCRFFIECLLHATLSKNNEKKHDAGVIGHHFARKKKTSTCQPIPCTTCKITQNGS